MELQYNWSISVSIPIYTWKSLNLNDIICAKYLLFQHQKRNLQNTCDWMEVQSQAPFKAIGARKRRKQTPPQHKCCCSHAFNNGFLVLRSAIESASKHWARADSIWRHWSAVSSEQCFLSPRGSCSGGIYEDRHADNLILSLFINPCVSPSEIMLGHSSLGCVIFLVCCIQHYDTTIT